MKTKNPFSFRPLHQPNMNEATCSGDKFVEQKTFNYVDCAPVIEGKTENQAKTTFDFKRPKIRIFFEKQETLLFYRVHLILSKKSGNLTKTQGQKSVRILGA